jgi:hypothetical protein
MILTYTIQTRGHYSSRHDEYFYDEYDFEYEPSEQDVLEALASILIQQTSDTLSEYEYNISMKIVKRMIIELDLQQELQDRYRCELKEWFEEEALESEGDR